MKTMRPTAKQTLRQRTRKDGRYSTLNRCELCGKGCGAEYFSDSRSNETGKGVTLHEKCADKVAAMTTEEMMAVLT